MTATDSPAFMFEGDFIMFQSKKKESFECILTNMCMVYDNGNILVQNRLNKNWPGVTFPGGHVENGESFAESVIREVYEETGLTIEHPILCGIKSWPIGKRGKYIVLFYKTDQFSGTLKSSEEGEVFWIKREDLMNYSLASDFKEMITIFEKDDLSEFCYKNTAAGLIKEIY